MAEPFSDTEIITMTGARICGDGLNEIDLLPEQTVRTLLKKATISEGRFLATIVVLQTRCRADRKTSDEYLMGIAAMNEKVEEQTNAITAKNKRIEELTKQAEIKDSLAEGVMTLAEVYEQLEDAKVEIERLNLRIIKLLQNDVGVVVLIDNFIGEYKAWLRKARQALDAGKE